MSESIKNKEPKLILQQENRDSSQNHLLPEEEINIENEFRDSLIPKPSNILIKLKDEGFKALDKIIRIIETCKGNVEHLETRKSLENKKCFDLFLTLNITSNGLINLIKLFTQINWAEMTLLTEDDIGVKDLWFPRHISELDYCHHLITKYNPELDNSHPGYSDPEYRIRRKLITDIAFNYKYGEPIPRIKYTESEIKTWGYVYKQLVGLYETHACRTHVEVFRLLEKECGYAVDNIPQLQDISLFLKRRTGFTLRPAAGLLTARDFLASLAFRVFQTTQFVRHPSNPHHSPEPDCIHELIGHIPILADPAFAQFSQEIGLASLGASDEDINKIATLYFYSFEFGLCKEGNEVKAYGAGLLSSYGELKHSLSSKPELRAFEAEKTAVQTYQDFKYQDIYYVVQNFEDLLHEFREYVNKHLRSRNQIYYDSFTDSIHILDSVNNLNTFSDKIKNDVNV